MIYIVVDEGTSDCTVAVIAAFTVKHEMVSWAQMTGNTHRRYLRVPDGGWPISQKYAGLFPIIPKEGVV
ncbi:MAG: hypothetical protein WC763_06945 [Candidatus Paceibacterota bacterium]